ncbi:hypothetical protein CDD81_3333 [Ophiocordyceps australis]|uniref:Uncharacterized protein n=1 Tax=Ophiocordyceps australis TaxID=1399860 RepID=A0A2C5XXD7_9HYPO|nr:hypothetical protein CDD81_3333 [Ophiocordyceps australis]
MLLWTAICFSTSCACSLVLPRASLGNVDLAKLIHDTPQVAGHKENIIQAVKNDVPFTESRLTVGQASAMKYVKETQRKCFYVRRVMDPESIETEVDVVANVDQPDEVTGEYEVPISISSSTATVNMERLGWNKEVMDESGGSASASAYVGLGMFASSVSATVFGSQRWSDGQSGDTMKQREYRLDVTKVRTCPPFSICRVVTWTYTRKLSGDCFILPILDTQCIDRGQTKGNTSLRLYFGCPPIDDLIDQFFDYKILWTNKFGPSLHGVTMHVPETVRRNKYQAKCTFSHALRWDDGTPVRAQALITEPLGSKRVENGGESEQEEQGEQGVQGEEEEEEEAVAIPDNIPRALEWKLRKNSKFGYCRLENNWAWEPDSWFYIPKSDGGSGAWQDQPSWPRPKGVDSKCRLHSLAPKANKAKRNDEAADKNMKMNRRIIVNMTIDELPSFLRQYKKTLPDSSSQKKSPSRRWWSPLLGWMSCPPGQRRDAKGKCREVINTGFCEVADCQTPQYAVNKCLPLLQGFRF